MDEQEQYAEAAQYQVASAGGYDEQYEGYEGEEYYQDDQMAGSSADKVRENILKLPLVLSVLFS